MRIFFENKVKGFGILDYAGKGRYGSVFGSVWEKLFVHLSYTYIIMYIVCILKTVYMNIFVRTMPTFARVGL